MKASSLLRLATILLALLWPAPLAAQVAAFTYQGQLTENGTPANGGFDFQFRLHGGASPVGIPLGTVLVDDAPVSDGLFTVQLDFGTNAFNGNPRWIEISVRAGTNTGAYASLTPLQPVTATPYAIRALNVGANGLAAGTYANAVTLSNPGNSFTGNGAGLTNVNAASLGGLGVGNFWQTGGNAGTTVGANFLGTTDDQPLEFKVNGARALRLEPTAGAPNVIGGAADNQITAPSAGGGVLSGAGNRIFNASDVSVVAGGMSNVVQISSPGGVIGGGRFNRISNSSTNSVIAGGSANFVSDGYSMIGGGSGQTNRSAYAFIGGGQENRINFSASHATIAGGWGNHIDSGSSHSTIGGGFGNRIADSAYATIAGGGGFGNSIGPNSWNSAIGGGSMNSIENSYWAVIPGGSENTVGPNASFSLAAGLLAKAEHDGCFVWADSLGNGFSSTTSNQFNIRAAGGVRLSSDTADLSFGSSTRQMIRLYGSTYAIGVQSTCLYQRSNGDFSWFQNGSHSDTRNDPGVGGVEMMRLRTSGLTVNGTFVSASDRNAKENIAAVNPREVLGKVATLPIARWNYKHDQETSHLGPMAQDFYAAFGVGPDDKHIATVDADGVALAAIQGLNQKLEETRAENAQLKARLESIERRLAGPSYRPSDTH